MTKFRQQFSSELQELRAMLIQMGELVEQAILDSVQSLKNTDLELARQVVDNDIRINDIEQNIEDIGAKLIATQQPVAKDLRRILVAFRMAADLERMADLAVDVAKVTQRIGHRGLIKPLIDIPKMAKIVQNMTAKSIEAYMEENVDLAYKMAGMDDEVDQLHSQILQELFQTLGNGTQDLNQVLLLSFVSRYLERMADHATNIGESVVYLVTGKRPDLN